MSSAQPAVAFEHVSLAFDDQVVLRDITFAVPAGTTLVVLGGSGSGKSVLLKLMLGLIRPDSGAIRIDGRRIDTMRETDLMRLRRHIGMLFQESALFDSLSVADNVGFGLVEYGELTSEQIRQRVEEVLGLIGLAAYIDASPADLSGGQRRRVAVARAMAARPSLLLFDEPTSGLDPITATTVDDEIVKSRDIGHATSVIVTHQVRDALYIAEHQAVADGTRVRIVPSAGTNIAVRFMFLNDGTIAFEGTLDDLRVCPDPRLRRFIQDAIDPPWRHKVPDANSSQERIVATLRADAPRTHAFHQKEVSVAGTSSRASTRLTDQRHGVARGDIGGQRGV